MIIIRKDTIWGPGEGYLYDSIQVAEGVTLTISAGAEIFGNGHAIEAYGSVKVLGTASRPILLKNVEIGLGENYKNGGRVEISYTHVSGGGINSSTLGGFGGLAINNSVITDVKSTIYDFSSSSNSSSFSNNVFLNSGPIYIGYGATSSLRYNIFDRYAPDEPYSVYHAGAVVSSGGQSGIPTSIGNAYLDTGAKTIELQDTSGKLLSQNDYFGTRDRSIISDMIRDANDDLSISNTVNLDKIADSPASGILKSIFSFASIALPRDIIVEARLLGTKDVDLTGNKLNNKFAGNVGNNTLDGGLGADTMAGGAGNDTYIVDNARDVILESAGKGYDRAVASVTYTLANNVEMLTLAGTKAINATGNGLANHLVGNGAANTLDGKGGADVMEGGSGNDLYYVDHSADRVIEEVGGGRDTVVSSVSYKLSAGQQVETLQLARGTGAAPLKLTGNDLSNKLIGNEGDNVIEGGAGADEMRGGAGNDIYAVDNLKDIVIENVNGGLDRVMSTISYALIAGQEIETLQLLASTGTAPLTLFGNEFGQAVIGNAGANRLYGNGGADVLTGGKGADTFVFSTVLGAGNVDRITDFAAEDTIRLSKVIFSVLMTGQMAEPRFKEISAGISIDADDRILYDKMTGDLFYDADGSGSGAAVKFAVIDNKATLTASDFLIM